MMLSLDTAYRSFGGEVEASSTPTICRLSDSRRHQLWAIAPQRSSRTTTYVAGAFRRWDYSKADGQPAKYPRPAEAERGHLRHACPSWVKLRKTQCEQMSSGLPLKADIAQYSRHFAFVPNSEKSFFAS